MAEAERWARLSETLTGPHDPLRCQRCGREYDTARWQEHDDADQPEPIVVVLCDECATAVIDAHPRLYRELAYGEPWPGTEAFCDTCVHRDGVRCLHPDLRANGGPGLPIVAATPTPLFLDWTDRASGKRRGEVVMDYGFVLPKSCAGHATRAVPPPIILAHIGPLGVVDGTRKRGQ